MLLLETAQRLGANSESFQEVARKLENKTPAQVRIIKRKKKREKKTLGRHKSASTTLLKHFELVVIFIVSDI